MTQEEAINILKEDLLILSDALKWLLRSFKICKEIGIKEDFNEEEYDSLETLASRFARVSDILLQKIFWSIDNVELEERGTLLDAINRMNKRGIIESIDVMREIRELRNQIVHEYVKTNLQKVFVDILEYTPKLIQISEKVFEYCKKYLSNNNA